jgi:hypothetical protein
VTLGWLGWLTIEVFKIVLKLKMSTNKHRIDGDEEIDVLHDYVIYNLSG